MRWSVWVSDLLDPTGLAQLKAMQDLQVTVSTELSVSEKLTEIAKHDILIVRSSTQVDAALIDHASKLKLIVRAGSGVDNIDVAYAQAKGIAVCNTPGTNSNAAAEHTIALMFALLRHVGSSYVSLLQGKWDRKSYIGYELRHKKLGLIGFGYVGQRVAQMAQAIGMEVSVYDPYCQVQSEHVQWHDSLDSLLASSDLVSLHAVLDKDKKPLINQETIAKMKKGSWLINTARAGLIDSNALLDALNRGHLSGAALDVLDTEPPRLNHPLVHHPQVLVTSHLGASTFEAQQAVVDAVLKVVEDFVQTQTKQMPA